MSGSHRALRLACSQLQGKPLLCTTCKRRLVVTMPIQPIDFDLYRLGLEFLMEVRVGNIIGHSYESWACS